MLVSPPKTSHCVANYPITNRYIYSTLFYSIPPLPSLLLLLLLHTHTLTHRYYVAVFLGGEWCHCDFTIPGKLLCIWLVAAGIGLFGIPVGAIFDAFEEIIEANVETAKEEREAAITAQVFIYFIGSYD